MQYYVILGKSGHPLYNRVFSEKGLLDYAEQLGGEVNAVPVAMPWDSVEYQTGTGGKGKTDYPPGIETKTIRVAADPEIESETKRYNIWLAWETYREGESDQP